jgi:hypothetical protein
MKSTHQFSVRTIRAFAHQHDDLPAFHAAYLILTILAAAMFNLGFFGLLICIHMVMDVYKYREVHGMTWKRTTEGVVRESILDIALFMMGLVVAVYLHPSLLAYTSIKGMMVAELTVIRAVGMLTPKLKILYDFLKILAHIDQYLHHIHNRLGKNPGVVEYVSMFSLCISVGMLIIAPILLMISGDTYADILIEELTPWNI